MRAFSFACLTMLLIPCAAQAAQEQHRYRESTGANTTQFDWTMDRADGIRILASEPASRFLTQCNDDGSTVPWQINDTQRNIQARREGDRLLLSGTAAGQTYAEAHDLDAAPWYQALSYSLRVWLASDAERVEFWTLRPDTLDAVKLRARRMGVEPLETRGGPVQAIHVELRANGVLAPFWKADYWFRADNRLFIRYQGVNGLPGTPETVIELLPAANAARTASIPSSDL